MPESRLFVYFRAFLRSTLLSLLALALCTQQAHATRFVSTSGVDAANDCTNDGAPCATLQWAVDEAVAGEEIRVAAGVYSGSQVVRVTRFDTDFDYKQVMFIGKALTVRGGYTESDWANSDPVVNVTTIDAAGDGRAVSIVDSGENLVVLDGFTLTGGDYTGLGNLTGQVNHACAAGENEDCGGGLYVYGSAFHLLNSLVSGNVASTVAGDGGGIFLWWARTSTIENTRVTGNEAPYAGGGLFVIRQYFPLTIRDTTFNSNTSDRGGGLDLAANIEALVSMEDCVLRGNTATGSSGGGLYARLTENGLMLHMQRVTVQDNEAWGRGKGVMLESAGPVTPDARLSNILFSGNTRVAGAPVDTSDAVLALGPGFTDLNVSLAHVTAAANPVGSFLHAIPANDAGDVVRITAANVLLSGFENGYVGEESVNGELTIEHSNTLFHEVTNHHLTVGGTPVFSEVDPVLGDPMLDGNYRLQAGSAAIDAGIDAGVSDDLDGNSRPTGAAPDIGVDEFDSIFADSFESAIPQAGTNGLFN